MHELLGYRSQGSSSRPAGNRLLDTLANPHLQAVLSHSTLASLDLAQVVYEPHQFFKHIYLPIEGVNSAPGYHQAGNESTAVCSADSRLATR